MGGHDEHPDGAGEQDNPVLYTWGEKPVFAFEPEPQPIRNLREYSNYLTPKLGLFSADTWTAAAMVVRNMLLNGAEKARSIMRDAVLEMDRVVFLRRPEGQPLLAGHLVQADEPDGEPDQQQLGVEDEEERQGRGAHAVPERRESGPDRIAARDRRGRGA